MEVLCKMYELWLAGLDIAEEKDSALLCGALLAFGIVYVPFITWFLEIGEDTDSFVCRLRGKEKESSFSAWAKRG